MKSQEWGIPYRETEVTRRDGVRLRYYVYGESPSTLVVANGHGAPQSVWRGLFELLGDSVSILSWDYRGQYGSTLNRESETPSIEQHCDDLDFILNQEGIEKYAIMGWSLGVQVALAQYGRHPTQVLGLGLIHGVPDRIMHHVLFGHRSTSVRLTKLTRFAVPVLEKLVVGPLSRVARRPEVPVLFERLGLIDTPHSGFGDLVANFTTLNLRQYLSVALAADAQVTQHWLHTINVPTLVTLGRRDRITPILHALPLFETIPNARIEIFDGSHFPMFESPGRLVVLLKEFLAQVEWAD